MKTKIHDIRPYNETVRRKHQRVREFEAPFRACGNGALLGGVIGFALIVGVIVGLAMGWI